MITYLCLVIFKKSVGSNDIYLYLLRSLNMSNIFVVLKNMVILNYELVVGNKCIFLATKTIHKNVYITVIYITMTQKYKRNLKIVSNPVLIKTIWEQYQKLSCFTKYICWIIRKCTDATLIYLCIVLTSIYVVKNFKFDLYYYKLYVD